MLAGWYVFTNDARALSTLLDRDFDQVDDSRLLHQAAPHYDLHPDAWTNSVPEASRGALKMLNSEIDFIEPMPMRRMAKQARYARQLWLIRKKYNVPRKR
jgi:hypothetical protein